MRLTRWKWGGSISIRARFIDDTLSFDFSDTGTGIPPDRIEQVFEPFYTTKDIGKGCGLGLTIVGEIVKGYNGKININSSAGKGSTFSIDLPIKQLL